MYDQRILLSSAEGYEGFGLSEVDLDFDRPAKVVHRVTHLVLVVVSISDDLVFQLNHPLRHAILDITLRETDDRLAFSV